MNKMSFQDPKMLATLLIAFILFCSFTIVFSQNYLVESVCSVLNFLATMSLFFIYQEIENQ
jgi:hypothetical protein